ncbi:MAG: malto-oligosyltrehalose trehalohydrolase [Nitrospira sp. LK70]|nr:malto-oligosyltrehalose trehalohydrolase [Nitrospira sp. LK70]
MEARVGSAWRLDLGANLIGSSAVRFRLWAARAKHVSVHVLDRGHKPIPMEPREGGHFDLTVEGVRAGGRYWYVLDGEKALPDPASRFQPDGVHKASAVIDPDAFAWTDGNWSGLALNDLLIYEIHTGTFTPTGTFEAIIPHLEYLKQDVGITAIELMPVAQFPGRRNWGYDGTYLYAPQSTYGGPQGLKALVNACHAIGLAVILDVVYNHLGPEGNYLASFGPYFTDRYRTPWGDAINYDGADSDEVRHFIISNALYWVTEYHIDALRLDAIHGIYDFSATHILQELAAAVHDQARRLGRRIFVTAESALNDTRVVTPPEQGGYGLDAQWNDDFHHALRTVLAKERAGYYQDYEGLKHLAKAMNDGFVYSGQYSRYHRRRHGNSSKGCAPSRFIVFSQNHDQIGNRAFGDRLSTQVSFEALKVAAAAVLLSPNIPLLFMGEESGETAPFLYFIDHGDPALVEAVRRGRQEEFASFAWEGEIPDPQDPLTWERSRVNIDGPLDARRAAMLKWTRELIGLRKTIPSLGVGGAHPEYHVVAHEEENVLITHRRGPQGPDALVVLSFNNAPVSVRLCEPEGRWLPRLVSTAQEFGGDEQECLSRKIIIVPAGVTLPLQPYAVAVFLRDT